MLGYYKKSQISIFSDIKQNIFVYVQVIIF